MEELEDRYDQTNGCKLYQLQKEINELVQGALHDLELVVVLLTLKIWCHYLNGVYVDVFTDQKILHYIFSQKELNLIHIKWLELLKDYDMSILYHPSKANVVIDALSILSIGSTTHFEEGKK